MGYQDLDAIEKMKIDAAARAVFKARIQDSGVAGADGVLDEIKEELATDPTKLHAALAAMNASAHQK